MTMTLKELVGEDVQFGEFKAGVFYQETMDWLLCLIEDVSYRAEPLIMGSVDILWHPQEDRIIGIKVWDASKHPAGQHILKTAHLKCLW